MWLFPGATRTNDCQLGGLRQQKWCFISVQEARYLKPSSGQGQFLPRALRVCPVPAHIGLWTHHSVSASCDLLWV